jgi:hypothetical protein
MHTDINVNASHSGALSLEFVLYVFVKSCAAHPSTALVVTDAQPHVEQYYMYSCRTRIRVFFLNKTTCLLVESLDKEAVDEVSAKK